MGEGKPAYVAASRAGRRSASLRMLDVVVLPFTKPKEQGTVLILRLVQGRRRGTIASSEYLKLTGRFIALSPQNLRFVVATLAPLRSRSTTDAAPARSETAPGRRFRRHDPGHLHIGIFEEGASRTSGASHGSVQEIRDHVPESR
jgi:hypothetical protein